MTAASVMQRSEGAITLVTGRCGLVRLRESGAAKARFPFGGGEAILINTGGGLAGGDRFRFSVTAGAGAHLAVTSQAAERVYRSLGPAAEMDTSLTVGAGATLHWLPQETIMYDGAALSRRITAELAEDATLLLVEAVIFGRREMGETVRSLGLRDRWRLHRSGRLAHADDLAIAGAPPRAKAALDTAGAMANIVLLAPGVDTLLEPLRALGIAASAWNGKLVARLVAPDGFELRKSLIPALRVLARGRELPRVWTF